MSDSPTVSILVTVYNREAYLEECVHSILNSSYEDFEVIMVDDCSKDGSATLMRKLAEQDSRVHAYFNENNLRDYPNRNRAASLARGQYIKYVDADDIIYRHSLATMVESMLANPKAALGLEHSLIQAESPYPWHLSSEQAYQKQYLERGCLSCGPSGAIMRRDAFESIGNFRSFGVVSDIDMWLRLAARWPVVLFQPGLVWWRVHEGQEIRSAPAQREYLVLGFDVATQALNAEECPLNASDKALAKERTKQHHARRILRIALKGRNYTLAGTAYKQSGMSATELIRGLLPYR